jgi:hypothetical protein
MNMKANNRMKKLGLIMSSKKKAEINIKEHNRMKNLRMIPPQKAEMNVKAHNGMKIFMHGIPNGEKIRRWKKEAIKKMKVRMTSYGNLSGKERNCGKEALKIFHKTQNAENSHIHKSIVCVICDWFIIGTETIHYLSKESII